MTVMAWLTAGLLVGLVTGEGSSGAEAGRAPHPGVGASAPPPLACELGAIPADQRARHAGLLERLDLPSRTPTERADGWAFKLGHDTALLDSVAGWIPLEARCCPFLSFEVTWNEPDGGWLILKGSPEVKAFIGQMLGGRPGAGR